MIINNVIIIKMERIIKYLVICVFVCGISSCMTSKQKIIVNGTPGTEIYNPKDMTMLGKVGSDGKVKIKISRNGYYPFLLSKSPDMDKVYPFGIDYKYKSHGERLAFLATITLCWYAIFDLGFTGSNQCDYGFVYAKEHYINSNKPNTPYANSGPRKVLDKPITVTEPLLQTVKSSSGTSKLLLKNYGKQLEGEYVGKGILKQGDSTVETYDNMKIRMNSVDRNTMSVEILLGEDDVILTPINYRIEKQENNNFVLISEDDDSKKIEIKGESVEYNEHSLMIEGEFYNLQIIANRNE